MRGYSISATYMKMYLQCLQKFYFRYYSDKTPLVTGEARAFGTAVHMALEKLYERLGNKGKAPTQEDYDYIIHVFMDAAVKGQLSDQDLYDEGRKIILQRLDKFNPNEKVLGLELLFGHPYDNPTIPVLTKRGTSLVGAIDKLLELDSDTIVVIDYKTSRTALTQDEADKDEQLSLYDLAVSKLYPQYKNIILMLDYLRLEPVLTHRTVAQRVSFEEQIDCVYDAIQKLDVETIKPNLNDFCGWCDYRNYCSAFQKTINDPDLLVKPFGALSDGELVNEWDRFSNMKRMITGYERDLKMHVSNTAMSRRASDLVGDDKVLYRIQRSRVAYNTKAVLDTVPISDCYPLLSVNTRTLERYLVDHPELAKPISETAEVSFDSSFFKIRKK